MPGEFFFMAIGGLGVSLAGFAGLISALDSRPGTPVGAWRIRAIVKTGLRVTMIGFGTVAVHALFGDVTLTVRIVSGALAVTGVVMMLGPEARPGPAWPVERQRYIALASDGLQVMLALVNVVLASVGFLHLLVLLALLPPMSIFIRAIGDIASVGASTKSEGGLGG